MTMAHDPGRRIDAALKEFREKCSAAWQHLFDAAKSRNEIYFAFSLMPEFRVMHDAGWNTAEESKLAFQEYSTLLQEMPPAPIKMRIALSFYSHISEAAGYYEMPKNLLRVAGGESYHLDPFNDLARHHVQGTIIAPNANKVMRDLLGHASDLGFTDLCGIIAEAFNPDLRNGYAHADYIIWYGDIRLRRRHGGQPRTVPQEEFTLYLNKAIAFFETLWSQATDSLHSYTAPARLMGRLNDGDPEMPFVIQFDPERRTLSISSGRGL
jgi:hypothetical protein